MPEYFPERDRPLWSDTEVRSLQKIAGSLNGTLNGDLFGRLKVSDAYTLLDTSHIYQDSGKFADDISGAGASVGYLINQSTVTLNVGTASGERVYRESRLVFSYQPGKSLQVLQTFVFNPAKQNLRQRVGYFSSQNGIFLQQNGTSVSLVKRSYISGAPIDLEVPQSSWNLDTMDGLGGSGVTLDLSKAQILATEYEWLGVGTVRVSFVINGVFIPVHDFNHANIISSVYMTSATLPIRYEIENTGITASSSTMKQICASVLSNGGYQKKSLNSTARRTTTASVGTDFHPLVSIRLASDRLNAVIMPAQYNLLPTTTGSFEYALIKNATLTGASYDTTTFPNVDFDVSATALSGGTVVDNGYFEGSNQSSSPINFDPVYNFEYQLGRNSFTSTSDIMTLAVRTLSGTNSVIGSFAFFDLT